ncbi:3'(2'),5'-bisphosphate nucleotidase CysQ [Euryhalocaulis caribicus]|uniref:3'(2'),5'-bisphosphate nucleotidase CysQ n=1 Tax=Euryhalocaulis caribicus TaxID=1161401 RepID=UPI00039D0E36|nr:3'(2'),5'-bisphosphate nucleotidase CysQ [Euryhalocaulis caribicus]
MSATNSICDADLIKGLERIALEAGRIILDVYEGNSLEVERKDDDSPVTIADQRAEAYILKELAKLAPGCPVVAEESVEAGRIPDTDGDFFLVDPLDGTKEFIRGGGDFTVNIGLVRDRTPVIGVVYAPATKKLYVGCGDHARTGEVDCRNPGEYDLKPMSVRQPASPPTAVASRSHRTPETDDFLKALGVTDTVSAGSSLKFCLVAEGAADVYPRLGRTMEWDTAAGHAVLVSAGGCVTTVDGQPLSYDKREQALDSDFANPHFIAYGSRSPIAPA